MQTKCRYVQGRAVLDFRQDALAGGGVLILCDEFQGEILAEPLQAGGDATTLEG